MTLEFTILRKLFQEKNNIEMVLLLGLLEQFHVHLLLLIVLLLIFEEYD